MSETSNTDKILHIQLNPWLYDDQLTDEDKILYKLKNICHLCGMKPDFHRDDCIYSANQLMLAGLQSGLFQLDYGRMQVTAKQE